MTQRPRKASPIVLRSAGILLGFLVLALPSGCSNGTDPATDDPSDECGGHGDLHGDHCDCDEGYSRPEGNEMTCVATSEEPPEPSDGGMGGMGGGPGEPHTLELMLLSVAGAESATAVAITPDGSLVGGSAVVRVDDVLYTVGAIWRREEGTRSDVYPALGLSAGVTALSPDGAAVGRSTNAEGQGYPSYPARIVDGQWQIIASLEPPQRFGWAWGAAAGVVVGVAVDADENTSAPWRWSNGETVPLGSFGGESGYATGINADGIVVGWSQTADEPFVSRGFIVPSDGTLSSDSVMIEGLGGATTFARAINSSRQVTGDGADESGTTHAFIWSEEDGIEIIHSPPEGVSRVLARAINSDGTVVGTGPTVEGPSLAWRWSASDGTWLLDDLVELPAGWHVRDASAVADDGSIVVTVEDDGDNVLPAVLVPR